MRILLLTLSSLALWPIATAQAPTKAAPASPAVSADKKPGQPEDAIPAVTLEFERQAPIPGVPASPAYMQPILCTPDGIPVVAYPKMSAPTQGGPVSGLDLMPSIYSFDPKGGHGFSPKAAPGLYDVSYHGYFVSDSIVGIEVRATTDDKQATRNVTTPKGSLSQNIYTGDHHEYILEFDLDGTYRKALQLPDKYSFRRVAALPDDTFLALAYDEGNRVARLLLLDSDMQILRPVQIPAKMEDDPALRQGESGNMLNGGKAETSLSWWLFAPVRNRIVLYQAHSKSPVLEVGAGGSVREVALDAPDGYVLDDILPANDRWLVQFRKQDLAETGEMDARPQTHNFVLYEADPNDGSLKRRIDLPAVDKDHPATFIACEQDGLVNAFISDGGHMLRYTADIPH